MSASLCAKETGEEAAIQEGRPALSACGNQSKHLASIFFSATHLTGNQMPPPGPHASPFTAALHSEDCWLVTVAHWFLKSALFVVEMLSALCLLGIPSRQGDRSIMRGLRKYCVFFNRSPNHGSLQKTELGQQRERKELASLAERAAIGSLPSDFMLLRASAFTKRRVKPICILRTWIVG